MGFRSSLRQITNRRVNPEHYIYRVIFTAARVASRIGLMSPSSRIELIHCPKADLVLTPLSGSSSIRKLKVSKIRLAPRDDMPLAILSRDDGLRAQSFYNKKVANADTIGKAILLSKCRPLTPNSEIDDFLTWLECLEPSQKVDKHLWSEARIIRSLNRKTQKVLSVNIGENQSVLEELIGQPLGEIVNSTSDVATYRPPQKFNTQQLNRARAAMAKLV